MRVVVGSDNLVTSPVFAADDGTPTAADDDPAVIVTDWSGAELPAATVAAVDGRPGLYTALLDHDDHCAVLDRLTLTWTATVGGRTRKATQDVQVVSRHYVEVAEVRALGADTASADLADIVRHRDKIADTAERYRGVGFVRQLSVEHLTGSGRDLLVEWPHATVLRYLSVDGDEVDVADYALSSDGTLAGVSSFPRPSTPGPNVVVAYEHGLDEVPPGAVEASLIYIQAALARARSGLSRDIIWTTGPDGTGSRYSTPNWDEGRPTGYIDVDRYLNELDDYRPAGIA